MRKDGSHYEVEPYALVWNNDFYYLLGAHKNKDNLAHYRVDRMRNVNVTDLAFQRNDFNISEYVNQSFHMYEGTEERIKIRFRNGLINVMIDRFGLDVEVRPVDEEHFILTTKAAVSEGLVRWLFHRPPLWIW
ncbi:WYL domain-containing protein [Bacillus sp. DJP31]|uniref:WYL domain-containing protein n=1 Tax=Bacillus sp. DJP31 TaxID=3409789 RepID=UPI003BB57A12